jgi:hypothetical protein
MTTPTQREIEALVGKLRSMRHYPWVVAAADALEALTKCQPMETAPQGTIGLYVALASTGELLGHDIGWLEDGDWHYASHNNEPCQTIKPVGWFRLPAPPSSDGV